MPPGATVDILLKTVRASHGDDLGRGARPVQLPARRGGGARPRSAAARRRAGRRAPALRRRLNARSPLPTAAPEPLAARDGLGRVATAASVHGPAVITPAWSMPSSANPSHLCTRAAADSAPPADAANRGERDPEQRRDQSWRPGQGGANEAVAWQGTGRRGPAAGLPPSAPRPVRASRPLQEPRATVLRSNPSRRREPEPGARAGGGRRQPEPGARAQEVGYRSRGHGHLQSCAAPLTRRRRRRGSCATCPPAS